MAMSDKKIIDINAHNDPELEALYQQASKPQPPEHLDKLIKQAAAEQRSVKKLRRHHWFSGIAASVIVGLLVLQLYPVSIEHDTTDYLSEKTQPVLSDDLTQKEEDHFTAVQGEKMAKSSKRQQASTPMPEQKMMMGNAAAPASDSAFALQSTTSADINTYSDMSRQHVSETFSDAAPEASSIVPAEAPIKMELDTPQRMIERIEKYIKEGEIEQARKEVKLLKAQYPDFEIKKEILKRVELD